MLHSSSIKKDLLYCICKFLYSWSHLLLPDLHFFQFSLLCSQDLLCSISAAHPGLFTFLPSWRYIVPHYLVIVIQTVVGVQRPLTLVSVVSIIIPSSFTMCRMYTVVLKTTETEFMYQINGTAQEHGNDAHIVTCYYNLDMFTVQSICSVTCSQPLSDVKCEVPVLN
jgi:uncharacterized membrane protein YkvI